MKEIYLSTEVEQQHLEALNRSLGGVAHPFKLKDLRMHGKPEDTSPLTETFNVREVGDYKLASIKARFPKPDGTFSEAVFTPLFMKEDAWQKKGAIQMVEADINDDLPVYKISKVVKVKNKVLNKLNKELDEIGGRAEGKKYRNLNIPNLASYEIHNVNPGRFVVISATNTDGETFPVVLNMMDKHTGMEGHIFVAEFPKSKDYALLDQPKPVIGEVKIGPPQGFAGPLDREGTAYQGLRDEMGVDLLSASLQQLILEEDLSTCLVDDRFFLLHLHSGHEELLERPDLMQNMEIQLDKLAKRRMSKKETYNAIKAGKINGAHAVAGIALASLNRGDVVLDPEIDKVATGLWLERVMPNFDPTEEHLSLVRGRVDIGSDFGGLYPDPTKFRDITPIRSVGKDNVGLREKRMVFASWVDLYNELRGGTQIKSKFGVMETAAIFIYGLQRGILIPKV